MPTRALLKYRNPDSTQDINDRLAGMFAKGIFEGGLITPVSGVLKINLASFSTVGSDGMFVKESNTTTLDVTAGEKNYIVVIQEYISNDAPVVSVEVLSEADFQINGTPGFQGANNPFMLVFGTVTLDVADTQVASNQIEFFEKDIVDQLARSNFRGLVDVPANLPSAGENINRTGDFFIVADGVTSPLIYAWDGSNWINITDAAAVAADLEFHANNGVSDQKHLTDEQASALVGTAGTPDGTNPYVTDSDPRFPTQDQQDALAGNGTPLEDSLPNSGNNYITSSKVFATPEELVVPAGTFVELGVVQNAAGYYVGGTDPADGIGTAAQWFNLYVANATTPNSYINDEFEAVVITDVKTGPVGGPPGASLDPFGDTEHVDANGFFIPEGLGNGTLFLILSNAISTGGARVSFGTRTQLGSLSPQLFMTRGPQSAQVNTDILRLLSGTPNAQFDDATWTPGINPGQVVGWNSGINKFVVADPLLSSDLNPVGVRGNANNLVQEGLITIIGGGLTPGLQYADKANPGNLTTTPNEWFLGIALDTSRFLVNMNGIALESSGEVSSGVAFPASLFDGSLQAGEVCAFVQLSNKFEKADVNDPTRLPVGIRGNSNTVILAGKYTALSGSPFVPGVKFYASIAGSLTTVENDWQMGIATDSVTLLVNSNSVPIPSKWTTEHDDNTGNHAFKRGNVAARPASPVSGTIFIRTDGATNFIEYFDGSSWAVATENAIPSGSKMMFVQDTVPTGWTFDAAINDRVVIITDDLLSGGVTGGGWEITGLTADPHAISIAEMPSHQHDIIGGGGGRTDYSTNTNGPDGSVELRGLGRPTELEGGGGTHTHGVTGDSTWRPNFVNVIICIKD